MQRLFSMFPKGAPGLALALMRVALGLGFAQWHWQVSSTLAPSWLLIGTAMVAVALCVGLFTPLMCAACVVTDLTAWVFEGAVWHQHYACMVLNAIGLAVLGPGAYSLDGKAFGRRRVVFPPSRPRSDGDV